MNNQIRPKSRWRNPLALMKNYLVPCYNFNMKEINPNAKDYLVFSENICFNIIKEKRCMV